MRRSQAGDADRQGDGQPSAVHLAEYDVERPQNRRYIGQHVAATEEVHCLQMRKAGRAYLAFVRLVAAVSDEVDAELALGRLDRGVDLAGGHVETFGIELEMMDER